MRISYWSSDVCSSDLLKSVAIGAQPRLFIFQDRGEIRNRLDAQCGPDGLIVEPGVFVRAAGCNRGDPAPVQGLAETCETERHPFADRRGHTALENEFFVPEFIGRDRKSTRLNSSH